MRRRVACRRNKEDAEHGIHSADHLQVVLALSAVPHPARGPDHAQRVDEDEHHAKSGQRELEQCLF